MKKLLLFLFIFLLGNSFLKAQTTLTTGDIAVTGWNSDGIDDYTFILFTDITAGTQITFTDNGWFAAGGFRSTETTCTWTATTPLTCGDQVTIIGLTATTGTVTGSGLSLSGAGDQLFSYQGVAPTIGNESNFLHAFQGNGVWNADATSSTTSAKPIGFTDGVNSISFTTENDNYAIDNTLCGSLTASNTDINNQANWVANNTTPYTLPTCPGLSCIPLSTNDFSLENTITLSPNPVQEDRILNINNNSQNSISNVEVFDVIGKKVYATEVITERIQFPNTIPSGMYFVKITDNKSNSITKKIILK